MLKTEICEEVSGDGIAVPKNLTKVLSFTSDNVKQKKPAKRKKVTGGKTFSSRLQAIGNKHFSKFYSLRLTPARLKQDVTKTPVGKKQRLAHKKDTPGAGSGLRSSKKLIWKTPDTSIKTNYKKSSSKDSFNQSSKVMKESSTPQYLKRPLFKFSKKFKTSEELEMEKIAELRQQLSTHRELSRQSMKKAMVRPTNLSVNSSASSQYRHTLVKPFHFATDDRLKNISATKYKEKDFVSSLRNNTPSVVQNFTGALTKPIPFKLSENRKRKFEETKESYHTLAEQIDAFQKGCFDKYFTSEKKNESKDYPNRSKLTMPHTPQLRALTRHRPVTALSYAEKEDLLIQEMQSYKFKARTLNPKILTNPHTITKLSEKDRCIKPEEVHLETEKRYMLRQRNCPVQKEPKFEFHANPVPEKILKTVVGLKEKIQLPGTTPKSPSLALKQRAEAWKTKEKEQEKENIHLPTFKAQPLPHVGIPFHPQLEIKATIAEPFSFEDRDKDRWLQKMQKIKEERLKEIKMHEFYAQPISSLVPSKLPEVPKKPVTQFEPFNLLIEQRGEERAEKWRKQMEEEFEREKAHRIFKARDNQVIYQSPFVPEKSSKILADTTSVHLNTERRAEERERYEYFKMLREMEVEEQLEKLRMEKEIEEMKEIARLRAETVHKPLPVKRYPPMKIKQSSVELTHPQSPYLNTRLRSRQRLASAV